MNDCGLIGLQVTCSSHNDETGTIRHVFQTGDEQNSTRCVIVFEDGHIGEHAASELKAVVPAPPAAKKDVPPTTHPTARGR